MLGNNIKNLRQERKITQSELAKKMNVSQQTIGAWETGRAIPSSDTLNELANFFDVSADFLLGREQKKPYYMLNEKDEKDISKRLENIIDDLENTDALAFSKEDAQLDEETNELLIDALHHALRIAKIKAKKKYTPKKYRNG